jgi:PIN domain nuclease of toxin-antitoxin system
MKLLLDTHTFIWWDSEPDKLSPAVLSACQDRTNTVILSVVSAWEMLIKSQLGKLKLSLPLSDIIKTQQQTNDIQILPVTLEHVLALQNLPDHHRDPFDRLLIAQAEVEDAVLVSSDSIFSGYPVNLFW